MSEHRASDDAVAATGQGRRYGRGLPPTVPWTGPGAGAPAGHVRTGPTTDAAS